MTPITSELATLQDTPIICTERRALLEERVKLSGLGLAALSTREITTALALHLEVPQDLLPRSILGNAALTVAV